MRLSVCMNIGDDEDKVGDRISSLVSIVKSSHAFFKAIRVFCLRVAYLSLSLYSRVLGDLYAVFKPSRNGDGLGELRSGGCLV